MARVPAGIKKTELVELLDIDEQIKALEARKKPLRDKALRAHAGRDTGPYVYGDVVLTLSEAGTFNSDAFAEDHPADQHPEYYAPAVVRKAVPETVAEQYLTVTRRLGIRRAKSTATAA